MKRLLVGLFCLILLTPPAWAGPPEVAQSGPGGTVAGRPVPPLQGSAAVFQSFSGQFSEDRLEMTFFMLLQSPKKLSFQVRDSKGIPLPLVNVVEVSLTSNSAVSVKNPAGLALVDLTEQGIYEIKIKSATGTPTGFNLKVFDQGAPAGMENIATSAADVASTKALRPATDKIPVFPMNPKPLPLSVPATDGQYPKSSTDGTLLKGVPATSGTLLEGVASESKKVGSALASTPLITPSSPPALPASETKVLSPSASVATVIAPPAPAPQSGKTWKMVERYPTETGYADPYKPIEVKFDSEIPVGTSLEKILKVFLISSDGREQPVSGQFFPVGNQGLRFAVARLQPGAIYHVQVLHPVTGQKIDGFSFPTIPELMLSVSVPSGAPGADPDADVKVELDWKKLPELGPSEESQVVRLDSGIVALSSGATDLVSFRITPDLSPSGNNDGISYSGRPFHFTLRIPRQRVEDGKDLVARVLAPISGRKQPVEIARASLKRSSTLSVDQVSPLVAALSSQTPLLPVAAIGTTPRDVAIEPLAGQALMPAATATLVVSPPPATFAPASSTLPAAHLPASSGLGLASTTLVKIASAVVSLPAKVRPVLKPVVPVANLGPSARIKWERKIAVSEGGDSGKVSWPKGVAWHADGSLMVVDSQNRRVLCFADDGTLIKAFGRKEKGMGRIGLPMDIAMNAGRIFVSDTAAHCIHVFDLEGNPLTDIANWGVKPGELDLPNGITVSHEQVWVADSGNCVINRYGFDGVFKGGFGRKGESAWEFTKPFGIRVFGDNVWVLDGNNGRVMKFRPDGKYVGQMTIPGVKEATALEIDPWGCLWLADSETHRVMRLDSTGKILIVLETPAGAKPWIPTSISVRPDGLVALGDGSSRCVHLLRLSKP